MRYKKPFIPPIVTATCNILNQTAINSTSHCASIAVHHHLCSQSMLIKGSPPKAADIAPPGSQFRMQHRQNDNSELSDSSSQTATGIDSWSVKYANQYHPPHGYGYHSSPQPFRGAPQVYRHSPFIITNNSSQPTPSVSPSFPSYGSQWQWSDLHQGGSGESQTIPLQQFAEEAMSSPGALRMPPGPAGNNPVHWPTSSTSTPPARPPSSAPERPPINMPTKSVLPAAKQWKTDVIRIADLPPSPEISYIDYPAYDDGNTQCNLGGAGGKLPVSLKQTEIRLKQFAKTIGQANCSAFNKWQKVWVDGFLEKKHRSIIQEPLHFKKRRDGPLHWETAVAELLAKVDNWLLLEYFDNAEWFCWQWVLLVWMNCAREMWEVRTMGRQNN